MSLEGDSAEKRSDILNQHPLLKALVNLDFRNERSVDNLDEKMNFIGNEVYLGVGVIGESTLIRTMSAFGDILNVFGEIPRGMKIKVTQAIHLMGYEIGNLGIHDLHFFLEKLEGKFKAAGIFNKEPSGSYMAGKFIFAVVGSGVSLRSRMLPEAGKVIPSQNSIPEPFKDLIKGLDVLDSLDN